MATLLIIEDELNIRRFFAANLKARGFRIIEAESAEQGLDLLYQERPDVMILDIKLPHMNGWELLQHVADTPEVAQTPVIVISASAITAPLQLGGKLNIVTRLSKPISVDDLLKGVDKALNSQGARSL